MVTWEAAQRGQLYLLSILSKSPPMHSRESVLLLGKKSFTQSMIVTREEGGVRRKEKVSRPSTGCFEHTRYHSADMESFNICPAMFPGQEGT